jgi:hypothetical protein
MVMVLQIRCRHYFTLRRWAWAETLPAAGLAGLAVRIPKMGLSSLLPAIKR